MEECLAIKPDLIFLWDEAWFGFARFSPFLRPRTAMGAARGPRGLAAPTPAYLERYEAQDAALGEDLDPKDAALLDTRLMPDPRKVTHARLPDQLDAQVDVGAAPGLDGRWSRDEDFHTVERPFKEAVFTHASTSPNQQIIASLDVARRQMELEGYELVMQRDRARARDPRARSTSTR